MRNKQFGAALAGCVVFAFLAVWAAPAGAQSASPKEIQAKAPMYSYIAVWNIPRTEWAAKEKQAAAAKKILDQGIADGTIVSYGYDENPLHDTFWLAMSKAALEKMRDQFQKIGFSPAPAPGGTTAPSILISRYYDWRTIRCENSYVHVGIYKMKPQAGKPQAGPEVVDALSRNFFAPVLAEALAENSIFEWETDTYDNPKDGPRTFLIAYLSETKEGLDKVNKAVQAAIKANPANGPAFESLADVLQDVVVRSYAVYKK